MEWYVCPDCGYMDEEDPAFLHYCPECGTEMIRETEDEDE